MKTFTIKTRTTITHRYNALSIVDKWELWLVISVILVLFIPLVGVIKNDNYYLQNNTIAQISATAIVGNFFVCFVYRFIKRF